MARKTLPEGEKKSILTIYIEGKYLKNQDKDKLRSVAYEAILKFVNDGK